MKKKSILLILTIVTMVFLFSGCRTIQREEADCEENAEINAEKYIKEKYGFEPDIYSVDTETNDTFYEKIVGAFIEARYNGKTFNIQTSCDRNDTSSATDNYQSEEIEKSLREYYDTKLKEIFSNNTNIVYYRVTFRDSNFFLHETFDKNNISEDLLKNLDSIDIVVLGENSVSTSELEGLTKIGYRFNIYNIKNLEDYNKYAKSNEEEEFFSVPTFLLYSTIKKSTDNWETIKYNAILDNGFYFISSAEGKFIEPINYSTHEAIAASEAFVAEDRAYKILTDKGVDIFISPDAVAAYSLNNLELYYSEFNDTTNGYYQDPTFETLTKYNIGNETYIYYSGTKFRTNDIIDFFKII